MQTIVLATNNQGKIKELQEALGALNLKILPQVELNIAEIPETGLTFVENAILKARHASKTSGLPALADDSGLVVKALQGAPGVLSARYADAKTSDPKANIAKLLRALKDQPPAERKAFFYCVLVLMMHAEDPTPLICQGVWEGFILEKPQGEQGFGYDPIFYVPTHNCSAAELTVREKNTLSHRGQALQALKEIIKELF